MDIAYSVRNVPIRLTNERWVHIVENHDELAGFYDDVLSAIENPQFILRGHGGTLVAIRGYKGPRYLSVVYREQSENDGFVITAYFTSKLEHKRVTWKRQ